MTQTSCFLAIFVKYAGFRRKFYKFSVANQGYVKIIVFNILLRSSENGLNDYIKVKREGVESTTKRKIPPKCFFRASVSKAVELSTLARLLFVQYQKGIYQENTQIILFKVFCVQNRSCFLHSYGLSVCLWSVGMSVGMSVNIQLFDPINTTLLMLQFSCVPLNLFWHLLITIDRGRK